METTTTRRPLVSTVGRKLLTGATGVLLILYLLQHLYANLGIFSADPAAVSKYALALGRFGPLLTVVEMGLAACFLAHIVVGVLVWMSARRARGTGYEAYRSVGPPSRQTLASRTMILSGLLILVFLILHVGYFRFGPGLEEGYVIYIGNEPVRHFERLVVERFERGGYVLFYVAVMIVLGFHLSHGFWSAFQSLGWVTKRSRRYLVWGGIVLSVVVAAGFALIPIWVYFSGGM